MHRKSRKPPSPAAPAAPAEPPHAARLIIDSLTARPSASILEEGLRLLRRGEAGEYRAELHQAMVRGFARVLSMPEPSAFALRTHQAFRRLDERPWGGGTGRQPVADQETRDQRTARALIESGYTSADHFPFMPDPHNPGGEFVPNPAYKPPERAE